MKISWSIALTEGGDVVLEGGARNRVFVNWN